MNCPSKLFKYVIPDRIDILNNQLIRFTQPSALNDPFELQLIFGDLFSENELNDMFELNIKFFEEALNKQLLRHPKKTRKKIVKQLVSQVQKNPQILQEEINKIAPTIKNAIYEYTPKAKQIFSDVLQTVGILSLSEKFDHPLLWAHYADSHKGFIIEFEPEHIFFNRRRSDKDELFHLRKVKYINKSSIDDMTLSEMHGDDILATKDISWEYEAEWRMIVPLASANKTLEGPDKIHLYTVPLSSISSIIVGARATSMLYEELRAILALPNFEHISLKRAKLNTVNQTIHINE
ncbi:Protein of unknown function [Nitrosomonas sp. Nm51]|uniref:DUF2971 domain-containing protein n=1 Tax=Nitrosomonas sp. Nm51 TaxID=133720 RepID=UPI0008C1A934|nr:DUF2971 domain-containing protein [Nitrosomonas sp. Nm51]SER40698.1 Protein of unknown function [Nitrosomonas sp. Nm51]